MILFLWYFNIGALLATFYAVIETTRVLKMYKYIKNRHFITLQRYSRSITNYYGGIGNLYKATLTYILILTLFPWIIYNEIRIKKSYK